MNNFTNLIVAGIPLIAVVFGLVEFSKSLGAQGRLLTAISMLLGIGFGIGYQIATTSLPVGFGGWFTVVVYGIALGLVASGFYDFADSRFPKIGP